MPTTKYARSGDVHIAYQVVGEGPHDLVLVPGLEVRAGLHTGECEVQGEKLSGIAVHTGARVASVAGPGEVFVSGTDLVAGSGIRSEDRGAQILKGIPGEWHLFAVASA